MTPAIIKQLVIIYEATIIVLIIAILSASLVLLDAFSPSAFAQSFHI